MPRPFAVERSKPPRRMELLPKRIGEMLGTRRRNDEGVNRGLGFTKVIELIERCAIGQTSKGDRIDGDEEANRRSKVVLQCGRRRFVRRPQIRMSLKMKTREVILGSLWWDADHRSLLGDKGLWAEICARQDVGSDRLERRDVFEYISRCSNRAFLNSEHAAAVRR